MIPKMSVIRALQFFLVTTVRFFYICLRSADIAQYTDSGYGSICYFYNVSCYDIILTADFGGDAVLCHHQCLHAN